MLFQSCAKNHIKLKINLTMKMCSISFVYLQKYELITLHLAVSYPYVYLQFNLIHIFWVKFYIGVFGNIQKDDWTSIFSLFVSLFSRNRFTMLVNVIYRRFALTFSQEYKTIEERYCKIRPVCMLFILRLMWVKECFQHWPRQTIIVP